MTRTEAEKYLREFCVLGGVPSTGPNMPEVFAVLGYEHVKSAVVSGRTREPSVLAVLNEWCLAHEASVAAEAEKQRRAETDRAIAAAEKAASAAEASAGHTERAARYAMWAAVVSAIVAALPFMQQFVDWLRK